MTKNSFEPFATEVRNLIIEIPERQLRIFLVLRFPSSRNNISNYFLNSKQPCGGWPIDDPYRKLRHRSYRWCNLKSFDCYLTSPGHQQLYLHFSV